MLYAFEGFMDSDTIKVQMNKEILIGFRLSGYIYMRQ